MDIRRLPFREPSKAQLKKVEVMVDELVKWNEKKPLEEPVSLQTKLNRVIFDIYEIVDVDAKAIDEFYFTTRSQLLGRKVETN